MADAAHIAAADNRAAVARKVKQVGNIDGTSIPAVRKWLKEIDVVYDQLGRNLTLQVIDSTTSGRLLESIETYTAHRNTAGEVRNQRHWRDRAGPPAIQGLRAYIVRALLGENDAATLRREVSEMKQTDFETTEQYLVRFGDAASAAFVIPRDALTEELLVSTMLRGLADTQVAYEVTMMRRPATLTSAMIAVREAVKTKQTLMGATAKVAAVTVQDSPDQLSAQEKTDAAIAALAKDIARVSTKVGELRSDVHSGRVYGPVGYRGRGGRGGPRGGRGRGRGNAPRSGRNDGVCFNCGRTGHFARDCRAAPAQDQQQQGNLQ